MNINKVRHYIHYLSKVEKLFLCLLLILVLGIMIANYFINFFDLKNIMSIDILAMLSITIGFNITFLSITTLSRYSSNLYKKEIKINGVTTTMFHNLLMYFKAQIYFSFILLITTILYLLFEIDNMFFTAIFTFFLVFWVFVTFISLKYVFVFIIKTVEYESQND